MEKFQELILESKRKITIADHMLNVSYKLVQDPKILLSITLNLYTAVEKAMTSVLEYERLFKRVPSFTESFDSKFTIFRGKFQQKHSISKENIKLVIELREIHTAHKKSPVEFAKKDKFVIASDDYDLKTLEFDDVKKYMSRAKVFIQEMDKFVSKNDGIFR